MRAGGRRRRVRAQPGPGRGRPRDRHLGLALRCPSHAPHRRPGPLLRRGGDGRRRGARQTRPRGVPGGRVRHRYAAGSVSGLRGLDRRRAGGPARGHAMHRPHDLARGERAARGRSRGGHARLRGTRVALDRPPLDRPPVDRPGFWDGLYARGEDGWELGAPAPALLDWLDSGSAFGAVGPDAAARVAVPGCGRGHDCRLLASRGYEVWGFDFSSAAITEARALDADRFPAAHYEQRDIFTLEPDYAGFFDAVWEYTCFCAIDPARRQDYARLVRALLRPGGVLLGCFYPLREGGGGPPFPTSRPEIERTLAPHFHVVESGPPPRSVDRRRGLE